MSFIYIIFTILLTVYGQLVLKWRVNLYSDLPDKFLNKMVFLFKIIFDPYMLSAFIAVFIAGLCWISAMTKFQLSYAYPFVGLTFALVLIFSAVFFHEPLNIYKIAGVLLIISGIVVSSMGI